MPDLQWQVFAYIVSQVETPLVSAVAQVMNAFLALIAAPLKVALVLYIALTGILILRGEVNEAGSALLGRFLKMALVVWVLTGAGVYQQYVYDFFFTTLPQGLAQALTASGTTPIDANSFDQVWVKAWRAGLEVWRTLKWNDIAEKLVVCLFWIAAILSTVFAFAIWLISRVLLALYIALGCCRRPKIDHLKADGGCGQKLGLVYAVIPRLSRYSRGLRETEHLKAPFKMVSC